MTSLAKLKGEARQRANDILADMQISVAPVPVDRIAKAQNVAVRYAPLDDGLSGMAFIRDDTRVIAVNALHHVHRQRFTIAHELAHHVLHSEILTGGDIHVDRVILHRDDLAASGTDKLEITANAFASELLMPDFLIRAEAGDVVDLLDEAKLARLAKRFKVSMAALQFRLVTLG